ncbi:MAG: pyridoxamine 5'-phosphate oxidase family protein [Micromonosporaceae bacterium]
MRDNGGLEVLGRGECLRLLARVPVGRIAVTSHGLPEIHPVSYLVDGDHIVFRTSSEHKLAAATHDAVVAFEADDLHDGRSIGWSVMVTGRATQVTDPNRLATLGELAWDIRIHKPPDQFVQISLDLITGRRVLETNS